MAGIYIHVPFCTRICNYCDFYKSGNTKLIPAFTKNLLLEIDHRSNFINDEVNTIYFGGGTPSVLPIDDIAQIINRLRNNFKINYQAEITIEVNPDDLSLDYLTQIKSLGINRLSIGIQSFNNDILKFLNRRHDGDGAKKAISLAQMAGFDNISCDLIYGIPGQTLSSFESDLKVMKDFQVSHLSAYHLGIEEGTYFGRLLKQGKIADINEELSNDFFKLLVNWLAVNGFEHYEVSNFAQGQKYSKHNMNYWFNIPYLGLGPSAHSFDGTNRFYNESNLKEFCTVSESNNFTPITDNLSQIDRYNEFILLRLRTMWGFSLDDIKNKFSQSIYNHTLHIFSKFKDSDYLRIQNRNIYLSKEGFFVSDYVVREFFIVE